MPILNWLDRDKHVKLAEAVPYRLLEADDTHSAGDPASQNMIIQGDNLDALKALLPYYAGRVKCIYIDPPYNTKSAFKQYDDNLEHSQWLAMMFPRLIMLRELLAKGGAIFIQLDDNEVHYLKVIMDEIFGRLNFVSTLIWRKKAGGGQDSQYMATEHEYILCYKKGDFSLLFDEKITDEATFNKTLHNKKCKFMKLEKWGSSAHKEDRPTLHYSILDPNNNPYFPKAPDGRDGRWRVKPEKLDDKHKTWVEKDGRFIPYEVIYYDEIKNKVKTIKERTILYDLATTTDATKEIVAIFGSKVFDTPKPERLIEKILSLATEPNDIVLDSFLGSGTTAAVAHKMGRRYIGIEMGEHAVTHCVPRLRKVIDGEQGGISEAVGWEGGGGFRFCRLGEPVFDAEGRINPAIRFAHLAAHIWFAETQSALHGTASSPLIGVHNDIAYYLLYNGILGDKRPDGGNVLTAKVLESLPPHQGQKIIYGEASRINATRRQELGIVFKQTPYDVKAR
jgi:adenine-specific DNA-methyltransferase